MEHLNVPISVDVSLPVLKLMCLVWQGGLCRWQLCALLWRHHFHGPDTAWVVLICQLITKIPLYLMLKMASTLSACWSSIVLCVSSAVFAWEAYEKGSEVHLQADPTKLQLLHQSYRVKKDDFKEKQKETILERVQCRISFVDKWNSKIYPFPCLSADVALLCSTVGRNTWTPLRESFCWLRQRSMWSILVTGQCWRDRRRLWPAPNTRRTCSLTTTW